MSHAEFRALFDAHVAFVWRVLSRHGLPRQDLDDGCQEVFLVVHQRLAEFEGRSSLRTWLYGVAVRVALGMRRRAHRQRAQLTGAEVEAARPAEALEILASRELHHQLTAAMASLPRTKREVFALYELEDMTIAQAAEALGIPENTALYRLYAAREAVVAFVRRHELIGNNLRRLRREGGGVMTTSREPKRWSEADPTALPDSMQLLLRTHRATGPDPHERERIWQGLTNRLPADPGGHAPSPDLPVSPRLWLVAAAGLSAVLIGLSPAGLPRSQDAQPPAAPSVVPPVSTPLLAAEHVLPALPEPNSATPAAEAPRRPLRQAAPRRRAARHEHALGAGQSGDLVGELALLSRARRIVASDPSRALALADEHRARHGHGVLEQEREVLAIEALRRLGQRERAASRARRFAHDHPGSAHRARLFATSEEP